MQVQMLAREGAFGAAPVTVPAPGIHPFATTPNPSVPHVAPQLRAAAPLGPIALIIDTVRQSASEAYGLVKRARFYERQVARLRGLGLMNGPLGGSWLDTKSPLVASEKLPSLT